MIATAVHSMLLPLLVGAADPGAVVLRYDIALAIGLSIGLPCLAAGYAIARVGAAALGAASERPELLTRSRISNVSPVMSARARAARWSSMAG